MMQRKARHDAGRDYRERIYPRYVSGNRNARQSWSKEDYDAWTKVALRRLRGWLPLSRDAACLDVGCGAGLGLHLLKSAGYVDIVGIDISPEQVANAGKVWQNVVEADAVDFLGARKEQFDLIIGFDIIEHFAKDEMLLFLDVLYGALRPGGTLILQTPNAKTPWGLSIRYGDFTHEIAFTPDSLEHVLGLAGFERFEARECPPLAHGLKSLFRSICWRLIRVSLSFLDAVETGAGGGVYTRVFVAKAEKMVSP